MRTEMRRIQVPKRQTVRAAPKCVHGTVIGCCRMQCAFYGKVMVRSGCVPSRCRHYAVEDIPA
jgi:hypothetical protein